MTETILPGPRRGSVSIPASKSRAHRLLICSALRGRPRELICEGISKDIEATAACLREMGSRVEIGGDRIRVSPDTEARREGVTLRCGESGSTLRFLLPVAGAMGLAGEFVLEGRLAERPLQPLWDVLCEKGMRLSLEGRRLSFSGQLRPGTYEMPGNISSQFVSGLLFALPLLTGESELRVTGKVESADYIAMTEDALAQFGVPIEKQGWTYRIPGDGYGRSRQGENGQDSGKNSGRGEEAPLRVEADWSSAAFFLALGALSPAGVTVLGMDPASRQGDRRILPLLEAFGARTETGDGWIRVSAGEMRGQRIDASGIPDLVPVLAAAAAAARGETVIEHAERLRLKESDRLKTTAAMLTALGADIRETEDGLVIRGKERLRGGKVSSFNDHRIAMSAAVAAAVCGEPVVIEGAECTEKSFPGFWEKLKGLEISEQGPQADRPE